jgi:hypothetical protein
LRNLADAAGLTEMCFRAPKAATRLLLPGAGRLVLWLAMDWSDVMADDFKKKFESLADKLKIDPKKDGDLKKAIAEVTKDLSKEAEDFDQTLKSFLSALGKKMKDTKDKDEKKVLDQLDTLANDDMAKRYAFKDTSSAPS